MPSLNHQILGPGFAAEIRGVDLSGPLEDAVRQGLLDLWMQHKVVVFRDQDLDETALMNFTRPFGELFVHVRSQFHSRHHKEVMVLTNAVPHDVSRGAVGDNSELAWHSDQAYTRRPVWGTLLHAIELPAEGGETCFADLTRARETLPPDLEARIQGRRTRFSIHGATATHGLAVSDEQRARSEDVSHPLTRRHPYLDRCSLYLSPAHAVGIEGMSDAQAVQLLDALCAWGTREEFVYAHRWRAGDLIMWDNTQAMHRRGPFPAGQVRTMLRTGFYLPEDRGVPIAA